MTELTHSGFNKLVTSQKRDHNNALKYTELALKETNPEEKARLTEMASLYFQSARQKADDLIEFCKSWEESEGRA